MPTSSIVFSIVAATGSSTGAQDGCRAILAITWPQSCPSVRLQFVLILSSSLTAQLAAPASGRTALRRKGVTAAGRGSGDHDVQGVQATVPVLHVVIRAHNPTTDADVRGCSRHGNQFYGKNGQN